ALRLEVVFSLARTPAVVFTLFDEIDFFPPILPHIAAPEFAGFSIKRKPPRIAHAEAPDFGTRAGRVDERIVRRNGVRLRVVDVDAEDFPEPRAEALAVALRVAARSAVAVADVEHPVRAEDYVAAVVVRPRLVEAQHFALARHIR